MTKYSLFLYKKVRFIPHLSCHAHPSDDTIAKRVDQQRTVTAAIGQHVLQYPDLQLQWVTLPMIIFPRTWFWCISSNLSKSSVPWRRIQACIANNTIPLLVSNLWLLPPDLVSPHFPQRRRHHGDDPQLLRRFFWRITPRTCSPNFKKV